MKVAFLFYFILCFGACALSEDRYLVMLRQNLNDKYVGKNIHTVFKKAHLTSPSTEARWLYLNDKQVSLAYNTKVYKDFADALNEVLKSIPGFDKESMFLYFTYMDEGVEHKKKKINALSSYITVSKKTDKILSIYIIDYEY